MIQGLQIRFSTLAPVSEKPHAEERPPGTSQVVITDGEIFKAHVGGKLSVDLTSPLDTHRACLGVAGGVVPEELVGDDLAPDQIVPSPLDPRVGPAVAEAVAAAADVASD